LLSPVELWGSHIYNFDYNSSARDSWACGSAWKDGHDNFDGYGSAPAIAAGVRWSFSIMAGGDYRRHIWTRPGLQDLADDVLGKDCEHISGLEVEGRRHPGALMESALSSL
jgi:hypothetical protein